MKKYRKTLCSTLFALVFFCSASFATFYYTLFSGFTHTNSLNAAGSIAGQPYTSQAKFGDGFNFGTGLGFAYKRWCVELLLMHLKTDVSSAFLSIPTVPPTLVDPGKSSYNLSSMMVDVLFKVFHYKQFTFLLGGGLGYGSVSINVPFVTSPVNLQGNALLASSSVLAYQGIVKLNYAIKKCLSVFLAYHYFGTSAFNLTTQTAAGPNNQQSKHLCNNLFDVGVSVTLPS